VELRHDIKSRDFVEIVIDFQGLGRMAAVLWPCRHASCKRCGGRKRGAHEQR
jgi:hypothetical protein